MPHISPPINCAPCANRRLSPDNVDTKEELSNVVDLLHQHVEVHSILTIR
jgi:hypothetical protein